MNELISLSKILKTGSIASTDVALSGTLSPEASHAFVDVIKDNSSFLKKITIKKMRKVNATIDAWDVARGILVRVPSGTKPNESQRSKLGLVGCKLEGKDVQLFARILQDALDDNKDNPNFEKETFESFAKAFGNDLSLLGFIGEKDDYADSQFKNLNKGWLSIAKEDSQTTKLTHTSKSKIIDRLQAVAKAVHPDTINDTVILISPADYRAYNSEIANLNAASVLVNGDAKKFLGISLEVEPYMKDGELLATPLSNLVLGVGIDIRRNRFYDSEERSLKYIFDTFCDYEIVVKKWVTVASVSG